MLCGHEQLAGSGDDEEDVTKANEVDDDDNEEESWTSFILDTCDVLLLLAGVVASAVFLVAAIA